MINKSQITAEYDITSSRDLGFRTHPRASLQCLVGAFLPAESPVSASNGSVQRTPAPADSPRGVADRISAHFEAFRAALDAWKKVSRKLLASKPPKGTRGFVAALEDAREALETESVRLALALREAHAALAECGAAMDGSEPDGFTVHLGLPTPVDPDGLLDPAKQWQRALLQAGAFEHPQDPETPALAARADFIADEMVESLKEISREAKWLLTNEPVKERLVSLMQWLFDLRCECLEIAPALACLKTPVDIWLACVRAPVRPATNGAKKAQEPDIRA